MSKEILALQMIAPKEDLSDEVDGEMFSTVSSGQCGNWSMYSWSKC